jgi:hypothetical protein
LDQPDDDQSDRIGKIDHDRWAPTRGAPTARTLLTCHRRNSVNIFYWAGALVDDLACFAAEPLQFSGNG